MPLTTRAPRPGDTPKWLLSLHRWLGTLTVVAVGIHLGALVADSYVTFTLADLTIPFIGDDKPVAVGLGVVGLWLLVAVQVSAMMMRRLPQVWWRRIHVASYLLVLVVSWHSVLAGTDIGRGVYAVAAVALSLAPVVVIALRAAAPPRRGPRGARGSRASGRPAAQAPAPGARAAAAAEFSA
jgi:DMSO/TMAO reductase YedYZ heme-binding membrane subunit